MKTIDEILLPQAANLDHAFATGYRCGRAGGARNPQHGLARQLYIHHRSSLEFGFEPLFQPLLTAPNHNAKLKKGSVPSYGLTLQHYVQRITLRLVVNACPHAGDCTKVCVLDNGHGTREKVQRGRRSKTSFLVQQPAAFCYLLGYELGLTVRREGQILFRPNVNSDLRWDLILPSMFDPELVGQDIVSYGYTKDPFVLDTNGWITPNYRLAYSWNEHSTVVAAATADFLLRGGSVAMVTERKKGGVVPDYRPVPGGGDVNGFLAVDADLTDEWVFQEGAVGDLSAKGRARRLIGKSGFVVTTGAP